MSAAIHFDDQRLIKAMLGVTEVPKELEQEYSLRRRMLRLAGHSGPLGSVAMIDLIRYLGFDPAEEPLPDVPWERYPANETIRVAVRWTDQLGAPWLHGVLCGVLDSGKVAVRMVSGPDRFESIVRTFDRSYVRLAAVQSECDTLSLLPETQIDIAACRGEGF
jgi:hypothetical protein